MRMRVCSLALVGALGAISSFATAQEAEGEAGGGLERPGAFELASETVSAAKDTHAENIQIFSPLSPIIVEQEPVKLPQDQALDR